MPDGSGLGLQRSKSSLLDNIDVDLYTKPTDTHQYLLPSSCHPKHCSRNVPHSLALRIRRIHDHSEKSSLTLFHETPLFGSVVAQLVKQVSLNG